MPSLQRAARGHAVRQVITEDNVAVQLEPPDPSWIKAVSCNGQVAEERIRNDDPVRQHERSRKAQIDDASAPRTHRGGILGRF
jgi:hypothetical protein